MTPKILIGTPVDGHPDSATVTLAYHRAVMETMSFPDVCSVDSFQFLPLDIVRARSRILKYFVDSTCEYVLYWDRDNAHKSAPRLIHAMLSADVPMIGCTYPGKSTDWDKVEAYAAEHPGASAAQLEASGLRWVLNATDAKMESGIAEVDGLGFGFMLIRRDCAEAMVAAYPELTFVDKGVPTVAAFMPMIMPDGRLLSEDYAFCERWRRIGGKVHMIAMPVDHIGGHVYHGHAVGLVR